jgi:hypothetical protein
MAIRLETKASKIIKINRIIATRDKYEPKEEIIFHAE